VRFESDKTPKHSALDSYDWTPQYNKGVKGKEILVIPTTNMLPSPETKEAETRPISLRSTRGTFSPAHGKPRIKFEDEQDKARVYHMKIESFGKLDSVEPMLIKLWGAAGHHENFTAHLE
jgi:hypothetical protein